MRDPLTPGAADVRAVVGVPGVVRPGGYWEGYYTGYYPPTDHLDSGIWVLDLGPGSDPETGPDWF